VRKFFTGPFTWLLIILIAGGVMADLGLGVTGQRLLQARTIPTFLTIWMLLAATNLLRDIGRQHLQRRGKATSASLLRPIANSFKVVIVLLGAMLWLNNIGYEITALMAGLGVGGLALALVLQKPLEDVFGAVSLFMQQPVKVGDFCHAGGVTGTIEEISLRSTRIRTLANSVVTVPNSTMSMNAIDNLSARTKILHNPVIRLSLGSTTEQIRFVLEHVQKLLDEHADVQTEGARVRFQTFGYHALELSIFVYIMETDYAASLQIAESLNLSVLEIVAESGTKLAVPVDAVGDSRA
jgi:MscS family membrane protein